MEFGTFLLLQSPSAEPTDVAYRRGVDACLAFLEGRDDAPLDALHARRDGLAERECFEAAERVQRAAEVLEDIRRRRRTLGWIVGRQNFVVLLPTQEEMDCGIVYDVSQSPMRPFIAACAGRSRPGKRCC